MYTTIYLMGCGSPGGEREREISGRLGTSLAWPGRYFSFCAWGRENSFPPPQKEKIAVWPRETNWELVDHVIELCCFDFKLKWVKVGLKFD